MIIAIEGTSGTGKSTLVKALCKKMNWHLIPEYYDIKQKDEAFPGVNGKSGKNSIFSILEKRRSKLINEKTTNVLDGTILGVIAYEYSKQKQNLNYDYQSIVKHLNNKNIINPNVLLILKISFEKIVERRNGNVEDYLVQKTTVKFINEFLDIFMSKNENNCVYVIDCTNKTIDDVEKEATKLILNKLRKANTLDLFSYISKYE